MTITNGYTTLTAFQTRQLNAQMGGGFATDTARDAIMHTMIEASSRWIDGYCGRKFYTSVETRYYSGKGCGWIGVDDLVSVTSITTDNGGDRVYSNTWATTDYDLEPFDARNRTPAEPYSMIHTAPQGVNYFPSTPKSVKVIGNWGYADQTVALSTLTSGVNASTTTWPVASGSVFEVGMIVLCGTEQAYVDAISSNNLTVRRGANGTTAATHSSSDAVSAYQFGAIAEACVLYAQRLYMRREAVLGVTGTSITGQVTMTIPTDTDVKALLQTYKRVSL